MGSKLSVAAAQRPRLCVSATTRRDGAPTGRAPLRVYAGQIRLPGTACMDGGALSPPQGGLPRTAGCQ